MGDGGEASGGGGVGGGRDGGGGGKGGRGGGRWENLCFLFCVSEHPNPPDELAQNVSKKNPFSDELFFHFSFDSSDFYCFFNYLRRFEFDFRAAGINTETFFGRTVCIWIIAPEVEIIFRFAAVLQLLCHE